MPEYIFSHDTIDEYCVYEKIATTMPHMAPPLTTHDPDEPMLRQSSQHVMSWILKEALHTEKMSATKPDRSHRSIVPASGYAGAVSPMSLMMDTSSVVPMSSSSRCDVMLMRLPEGSR